MRPPDAPELGTADGHGPRNNDAPGSGTAAIATPSAARGEVPSAETSLLVIFFSDMKGSSLLKERMAAKWDEQAFQALRTEHDALLTEVINRDNAGEVIKSTGDGLLALFSKPSVAVERAIEIQERLHGHDHLSVRIGMDLGEIRVESVGGIRRDAFGRHVDWAARAMDMADGGHICVTRSVYTDAFSWITKSRIAWKDHGPHRGKAGEAPLDICEPYNANIVKPMEALRGEKVVDTPAQAPPPLTAARETPEKSGRDALHHLKLARSWEAVARDGRDFAENGAGMMYWFKVPLGGISYPEGFRNFLQPALANPRISKIRFVLDSSVPVIPTLWHDLVIPLIQDWARQQERECRVEETEEGGYLFGEGSVKRLAWVFTDLSREFTPCFKLLIPDPDTDEETASRAQIFLSTAARTVRFKDGTLNPVRIPDAVLRVEPGEESLLYALNAVANQWDSLFT